jgi:hypothetical protein
MVLLEYRIESVQFDNERGRVEPGPSPFAPDNVLAMCREYTEYCVEPRESAIRKCPQPGLLGK